MANKDKGGRKPRYETFVKPRLADVQKWAANGATEAQIAKNLGIGHTAWARYKQRYGELAESIKKGRQDTVKELRSALIKKALGYEYEEVKTVTTQIELPEWLADEMIEHGIDLEKVQKVKQVRKEVTTKRSTEDVAAINLALKNYDKDNWANDPQMLKIRREELELKKKMYEEGNW